MEKTEPKGLTDKQRIKRLEEFVCHICELKGCANLPKEYGLEPYTLTANDMTKYKKVS